MDGSEDSDDSIGRGRRRKSCMIHSSNDEDSEIDGTDGSGSEEDGSSDEGGGSDGAASAGSSSGSESSDVCPICLSSFRGQEIGNPESCDHSFCLDHILEWAKNVTTCPVDRQPFTLVLVRREPGGKITRKITIDKKDLLDAQEEEDPTYCEVCGRCDREDRLLLCDGCDSGYHLDCLEPVLERVPEEQWFCPECAPLHDNPATLAAEVGISQDELMALLDDPAYDSELPARRQLSRPGRPVMARTRLAERIRRRAPPVTVSPSSQQRPMFGGTTSSRSLARSAATSGSATARPKSKPRRRKTRRTKSKTGTTKSKSRKTGKRRRKTKRKTKRSVRRHRDEPDPYDRTRQHLRRLLAIRRLKPGQVAPPAMGVASRVRVGASASVVGAAAARSSIHVQRQRAGIQPLHLFGRRDDLLAVSDDDDDPTPAELGAAAALVARRRVGASFSRLKRPQLTASAAPTPAEPAQGDVLASIMSSQSLLLARSSRMRIERDGRLSLVAPQRASGGARAAAAGSPPQQSSSSSPSYLTAGGGVAASSSATRLQPDSAGTQSVGGGPAGGSGDDGSRSLSPPSSSAQNNGSCSSGLVLPTSPPKHKPDPPQPCLPKTPPPVAKRRFFSDTPTGNQPVGSGENTRACVSPTSLPAEGAAPAGFGAVVSPLFPIQRATLDNGVAGLYEFPPASPVYFRSSAAASPVRSAGSSPSRPAADGSRSPTASVPGGGGSYAAYYARQTTAARSPTTVASSVAGTGDRTPTYSTCSREDEQVDLYSDIEPPDAESVPSPDEQDSEDGETDAQVVAPLLATSFAALAKKADTMLAAGVQYASDVSSDEDLVIDDSVRRSTSRSPRSAAYIQSSDKGDEISKSVVTKVAASSSSDENSEKVSQITVGKVGTSDDSSNAVSKNAAAKAGTSSSSDDDSNKISNITAAKDGTSSSDEDGDNIDEITTAKANTLSSSDEDGDITGKIVTKSIYSYSDESGDKVKITAARTDTSSSDEDSVKGKVNAKAGTSSSDQGDGNSNKITTVASISPPRQHLLSSGTVSLEPIGRWRPLPAGGSAFNIPLPPTVGVPSPSEIPLPPVTETISSPESFGADLDEPTARQHRISRDLTDIFGSGSPARQTQPTLDDIPIPGGSFHGLPDTEQISDSEEPNEFDDGMEDGEIPAPVLPRTSPQPCSSPTAISSTAGVFGDHSREGDFEEGEIPPPAAMSKSPVTRGKSPAARDGVNSDDDGEIIDPHIQSQQEGAMDTSDDKSSAAPSKGTERGGDDEGLAEEDQIIVENYESPVVDQNITAVRNRNTTDGNSPVVDEEVQDFVVVEKTCSNLRTEDGDESADISWKKVSKSSRDRHYRGDVARPDWNDKVRPLERSVGELVSGSGGRPNDWCGVKSGAPVVSASGADDGAAQTLERNDVRRVIIDRRKSRRDRQWRSSSSSSSRDSGANGRRRRHGSGRRRRSPLPRSPRRSPPPRSPRRSPSLRGRSGGDRRRGASPSRRRSSPKRRRVWVSRSPSPRSRSAGRKRVGNVPARNRSRDRRRSRRSPSPEPKKMRKKKDKEKKTIKGDKKKRKKRDKASVSKAVIADGDNLVVSVNFPKNKNKASGKTKSGKKVRPSKKGGKIKTKRTVVADMSMYSPERHEAPSVDDVPSRCSPARVSSPPGTAQRRQSASMERVPAVPGVAESANAPGSGAEDTPAPRRYRRPARNGNHSGSESPRSTRRPAGAAGDSSSSESPGRSAWRPAGGALCRPPQLSPVDMDVVIVPTSDNEPILITDSEESDSDHQLAGAQSPEPVAAPTVGASSPLVAGGRSDDEEQDEDGEPSLTVQQRLDAVLGALTARSPRGPHTPSEPGSPPQHGAAAESAGVKFRLANRAVAAVTSKVRTLTNPLLAEDEEQTSPAQPLASASAPRGPSTPPEPPPVDTYDPFEPTNSPRSPPSPSASASPVASDQPAPAAASPAQTQQPLTAAAVFNSLLFARPLNKAADAPPMKNLLEMSTSLFAGLPPPKASSTAAAPQSASKSDSSRLSLSVAATASSSCTPPAAAAPPQSAAKPAAPAVNGQATAALSPPSPPHPATDMDLDSPPSPESPRSPDSREADDLFEPPSGLSVPSSTTAPATLPFSFDALFGGSAARSATKRRGATTTVAAAGVRPKVARNGQRTTVKTAGKRASDRLLGFTEMDEDNLRVLDDVPNSAVEMEVKAKYLKKLNRQERVIEEVKLVLKPFYQKRTVTKTQYKDILRKSVPKICHSKSGEINPNKIQTLVVGYVKKCRHENKKTGVLKEKSAAKRSSSKVRV